MPIPSTQSSSVLQPTLAGKEHALKTLEVMLKCRFCDEKALKLTRQNKGGTFHLSMMGHEMVGAVAALGLTPKIDWALPYYRDRAFAIGLGCTLEDLIAGYLARKVPHHSGGRMMPEHFSHKQLRMPCQSSCVGSQFLHAVGVAKGVRLAGNEEVVYVSAGDGATSQGDFHEALNLSCLHQLPVLFVIQDNGWAISVPVSEQTTGGSSAKMASGYDGLLVLEVDGCDYEALTRAVSQAVSKARSGQGPSLLVAKIPRLGPHSSSDDPRKYKGEELIEREKALDPLPRFEKWLIDMGLISPFALEELKEKCFREIEAAAERAERMPFPEPEGSALFHPVDDPEESEPKGTEVVMMDALNRALGEEMERDAYVLVFGQDVARGKGGVFGITRALTAKHGEERCFNTPLAESSIVGMAIGLACAGYRPVAEIQFTDYMWTAANQMFNELASIYYRSNGEWTCPVVLRMPYGGYIQGGPYHSQSNEAHFAHCPGLKVVVPSNSADAKRLLKMAIRDPNPVIFMEHKALYRQRLFAAQKEPDAEALLPFGKARIVREGKDVTIVAWGLMVMMAVQVADQLAKEGYSIEVIDLRTLVPLDFAAIVGSLRTTGKLLIAQEAPKTCGFAAEIAARISEEAFALLDAPVLRVAGKDLPVPYCSHLEDDVLPQLSTLEQRVRELLAF